MVVFFAALVCVPTVFVVDMTRVVAFFRVMIAVPQYASAHSEKRQ